MKKFVIRKLTNIPNRWEFINSFFNIEIALRTITNLRESNPVCHYNLFVESIETYDDLFLTLSC